MKSNQLAHIVKRCLRGSPRPVPAFVLPVLITLGISHPAVAATDFQLNFNAVLPTTFFGNCGQVAGGSDCTIAGGDLPNGGGTLAGNDGTRFIQEELTINNTLYFHVVVGDPALGFANESYTRASLTSASPNDAQTSVGGSGVTQNTVFKINPFSQDSGGNEINISTNGVQRRTLRSGKALFGNALDPFGIGSLAAPVSTADSARISGSATGNPSRTVMRMTLSDSQMVQEVNQPVLDRKPLISPVTPDNAGMTGQFQADLGGLTYSQKDKNKPIVNRVTLNLTGADALPTAGAADFDMTKVQRSTVTAGKFAYVAGSGWNSLDGWSHQTYDTTTGNWVHDAVFTAGTYSGEGNGFDPLKVDWYKFFNPAQNPGCANGSNRALRGICPP